MSRFKFTILFTILGGIAGYIYYQYFGCTSGCSIQSNSNYMTLYGAAFGFILSFPNKKQEKKVNDEK